MRQAMMRMTALAVAAGVMASMAVSTTTAEAMPVASAPAQAMSASILEAQYYAHPYRRYYRGYRYHRRRAGVYRCGPNSFKTHLSRKYC